jgi:drug/metabolite transporter (DMT)-like permease
MQGMNNSLRPRDLALALLVIVVWGLNFAVIKVGVAGVPPLLLGALRYLLAAFPARFAADQFDWPELYWLTLALCRPETAAMARLRQAIAARVGGRP